MSSESDFENLKTYLKSQSKQEKCPVCSARRERAEMMGRNMNEIAVFVQRSNGTLTQDSCILCVEKHVSDARTAMRKTREETDETKREILRLDVIGNLREATDEATAFPELHDFLAVSERDYRYNGNAPDWVKVAELIVAAKRAQETQEDARAGLYDTQDY